MFSSGTAGLAVRFLKVTDAVRLFIPGCLLTASGTVCYQLGSESKSFANVALVGPAVAEAMICFGFELCLPYLCHAQWAWLTVIAGPVRLLSNMSFSLYLTHFPLAVYMGSIVEKSSRIDPASFVIFTIQTAVAVGFGFAFWFVVERPSFMLRAWLKSRPVRRLAEDALSP